MPQTSQNQTEDWSDDEIVGLVRARDIVYPQETRPEYRRCFVIALHNQGIITKSDLAFLSYVFGLGIKVRR